MADDEGTQQPKRRGVSFEVADTRPPMLEDDEDYSSTPGADGGAIHDEADNGASVAVDIHRAISSPTLDAARHSRPTSLKSRTMSEGQKTTLQHSQSKHTLQHSQSVKNIEALVSSVEDDMGPESGQSVLLQSIFEKEANSSSAPTSARFEWNGTKRKPSRSKIPATKERRVLTWTLTRADDRLLEDLSLTELLMRIRSSLREVIQLEQEMLATLRERSVKLEIPTADGESPAYRSPGGLRRETTVAQGFVSGGDLHSRDVKRFVSGLIGSSNEYSVNVRQHAILLSFDVFRCIVLWDRLIVVVPDGADSLLNEIDNNLKLVMAHSRTFDFDRSSVDFSYTTDEELAGETSTLTARGTSEAFELQALEAVLKTTVNHLENRVKKLLPDIEKNIKSLLTHSTLHAKAQDGLRYFKNEVGKQQAKGRSLQTTLTNLLKNDHDLSMLNLTKLLTIDPDHPEDLRMDQEEVEDLLESYLADVNNVLLKWSLVENNLSNTEDYVRMKVQMAQNRLLTMGTLFALVNLTFAWGSVISGIFGMNLNNGISMDSGTPQSFWGFYGTVIFIFASVICGVFGTVLYMQKSNILVT